MPSIGVTRWHPFNFAYIGLSSNRVSIKYWVIVEPGFNQTNAMVLPEKWLPCFYKRFLCDDHLDEHVPLIGFFNLLAHLRKSPSNAFSESRWHSLQDAFSKCCRSFSDRPLIQSNSWWGFLSLSTTRMPVEKGNGREVIPCCSHMK